MAIQPEGDRVLFTNIDADPTKRAEFWTLVEEHERTAGSDQMSCRFADRAEFWAAVVRRNDCPPTLRDQHAHADHDKIVRFDIESGKAMRKFLEQVDGWTAKDGDDQNFAKFHDGRAGRTQYRIVGELPNELSIAAKVQLLRNFTEEFRRRRIPFVAVMHAPDHNNDEKNWHFHIVYYDRPCDRITATQIAELERNGHDTQRLASGMWDFAAVTRTKDRVNRELRPLRQKKVTQVGNARWIKDLRHSFARMTNVQLEKAGVARRVDPRSHADMGIVADPQEHLGTRQSATETRGKVTAAGTRNEERQSQAILAQIDQAHANALADAQRRVAGWKRRLTGKPSGDGTDPVAEVELNLIAAADLDHLGARLRHADDRATSRATNLKRMNGQLVQAIDADASAGSRRERQRRAAIVEAAGNYLQVLDVALRHDRSLVADCAAEAERLRGVAAIAEVSLEALVTAPIRRSPQIENAVPPVIAAVDSVEQWLRQMEARRPLIVTDGLRFTLAKGAMPVGVNAALAQARLKALYGRQQHEIAGVVRQLPANRLSLSTRTIQGRKRHLLDGVDPALARSFFRYQDSPEIKASIEDIFAGRFTSADRTRPPAKHVPVEIAREPLMTTPAPPLVPSEQQPVPVIARPPAVLAPAPPLEPMPQAPTPPTPTPLIVDPPIPTPAMPPAPLDPAKVARDLVDRNVPLTFDEDDRIDVAALLAAKVDPSLIGALQNNPFLAGRVGKQVEQALAQVQTHAKARPFNLIRKGEQVTLGGDAPAALIELSRFHSHAPLMQERLRRLHDKLYEPEEDQAAPSVAPVENQPISSKVEQASKDGPKPPSSADILHDEAARQAALRAAWQRGG